MVKQSVTDIKPHFREIERQVTEFKPSILFRRLTPIKFTAVLGTTTFSIEIGDLIAFWKNCDEK